MLLGVVTCCLEEELLVWQCKFRVSFMFISFRSTEGVVFINCSGGSMKALTYSMGLGICTWRFVSEKKDDVDNEALWLLLLLFHGNGQIIFNGGKPQHCRCIKK